MTDEDFKDMITVFLSGDDGTRKKWLGHSLGCSYTTVDRWAKGTARPLSIGIMEVVEEEILRYWEENQ